MNYTRQANEVLRIAERTAKEMNHPYIGTEHLLIGLRQVYTGVAGQVLDANGVEEEKILKVMEELVSPVGNVSLAHRPEVSPRLAYILEDSKAEAMRFRSEEIGTEHLLMALLRDVDCVACRILLTLNINMQKDNLLAVCGFGGKMLHGPLPVRVEENHVRRRTLLKASRLQLIEPCGICAHLFHQLQEG